MKCGNCKNLRDGWCDILYDSPDPDLERECVRYKLMTNYEKIKQMSIEEMAKFLAIHIGHYEAPYTVKDICRNAINDKTGKGVIWIDAFKLWLEMEIEK